jgi:MarR family transcriptional regulator, organic hydroperoxide resistance regulator
MKKAGAQKLAILAPKIMNAFHDLGRQHPDSEKLSMRQFQALIILKANKTLSVSKLCEKLSLAPSTGTELVNRMISLGFIEKGQEKDDYRHVFVGLSEKGEALLKKREQALTAMFQKFLDPFEPEDQEKFIQSFENIWVILEKYYLVKK